MTSLVLEQSTIDKLKTVEVGVEVRDRQGKLIGFFHPAITPARPITCADRRAGRGGLRAPVMGRAGPPSFAATGHTSPATRISTCET